MPSAEGLLDGVRGCGLAVPGVLTEAQIAATVAWLASAQDADGGIPGHLGDDAWVDPWDLVECAMALAAGGRVDAAERGYRWLRDRQRPDGSWATRYVGGAVADPMTEVNQCAYVAVGAWHHWLVTGDAAVAKELWPVVRRALDFVTSLQTARGEIVWNVDAAGRPGSFALLAGCSSIRHSLRCGLALAGVVGSVQPSWTRAFDRLDRVLRECPSAFTPKDSFAMDWYYPVLGGAVRGAAGRARLSSRWAEFAVEGLGVRCVRENPWVTGAETCELALALDCAGETVAARAQLASMQHLRDPSGGYWMGLEFESGTRWPRLLSTWTAAAVLLAADALSRTSSGSGIFRDAGG